MDHCAVFVRQSDGSWQPVETTSMGSYLLFTAEGENVQLAVLTTAAVWWLWAIFLVLIVAAVFFIVRVVHRRRRKKDREVRQKKRSSRLRLLFFCLSSGENCATLSKEYE